MDRTLCEAGEAVAELVGREAECHPDSTPKVNVAGIEEMVADKGYHSGAVVERVKSYGVRSYIPERQQKGQRHWEGNAGQQQAVYANRRRVQGQLRKTPIEEARRISGTQLRSLLRHGRHAAHASAQA